jgi:hypothetical protein
LSTQDIWDFFELSEEKVCNITYIFPQAQNGSNLTAEDDIYKALYLENYTIGERHTFPNMSLDTVISDYSQI